MLRTESNNRRQNGRGSRLTIREIAELAGVSTATVSRVINGAPRCPTQTREAVHARRPRARLQHEPHARAACRPGAPGSSA